MTFNQWIFEFNKEGKLVVIIKSSLEFEKFADSAHKASIALSEISAENLWGIFVWQWQQLPWALGALVAQSDNNLGPGRFTKR